MHFSANKGGYSKQTLRVHSLVQQFLSRAHVCLTIGLIRDFFVPDVDSLMGRKTSCGPKVLNHCRR